MPGCMFGTGADFRRNILQSKYCLRKYCLRKYCLWKYCLRKYCLRKYCLWKYCLRKYLIKCQRLTANTLLLERLVDGISKTQILFLDILYSVFIFHKSRHRQLDTTDNS